MRVARTAVVFLLLSAVTRPAAAQEPLANSLVNNTVQVQSERAGFGFIVGLRPGELLIATARHTLGDGWDPQVKVCFPPRGQACSDAAVVHWADAIGNQAALDLVILAVPDPGNVVWRPDVEAAAAVGDEVRVIGRSGQWWVSPDPGTVTGRDPGVRELVYRDLDVAPGVSGAPIISGRGIVAMHLQETRSESEARGLELDAVRERIVDHVEGSWGLVPPAECANVADQGSELRGRIVAVRTDPRRPAAALRAVALLHCLGARGMLRPVSADADWIRDGIVYRSGDLRLARALQLLVLPLVGRVAADLGEPEADLEIWIR